MTVSRLRVGETRRASATGAGSSSPVASTSAEPAELVVRGRRRSSAVERSGPRRVLVQALAKGDRDELAVQAATELGVDAIIPWAAARSISAGRAPRCTKGGARWVAVVREATKQSMRAWVPDVLDLVTTKQLARSGGRDPDARARADRSDARSPTSTSTAATCSLVVGSGGRHRADELDALAARGRRAGAARRTSAAHVDGRAGRDRGAERRSSGRW